MLCICCYIDRRISFSESWFASPAFLIAFCRAPGGKLRSRVSSSYAIEPPRKACRSVFYVSYE